MICLEEMHCLLYSFAICNNPLPMLNYLDLCDTLFKNCICYDLLRGDALPASFAMICNNPLPMLNYP